MKKVYALVTTNCNLSCKHCDIKNGEEIFNQNAFMSYLKDFDGEIILFGGEPTIFQDRLFDIVYSNPIIQRKIVSISTNLMIVNDRLITLFQIIGGICTSWNPNRFTNEEYQTWLDNINTIDKMSDLKLTVLITLTDDLLNMDIDKFLSIISKWNGNVIQSIRFEHYIDPNLDEEYFNRADEWLCQVYKKWNSIIMLDNVNSIDNWYYDCGETYTLYPNGKVKRGCPHNSTVCIPVECYTCERSAECKPCQLQRFCSYPKKFAQLVKDDLKQEE